MPISRFRRSTRRSRFTRRSTGRTFRRSRVSRRMPLVRAPRSKLSSRVHYFTRWVNLSTVNALGASSGWNFANGVGTTTTIGDYVTMAVNSTTNGFFSFGYAAQLRHLPNYAEFSAMYERFKIKGVLFKITPLSTDFNSPGSGGGQPATGAPLLHWVFDPDTPLQPTASSAGIDELREYTSYKVKKMIGKFQSRFFKPRILGSLNANDGAVVVSAMNRKPDWLSTEWGTNVDHMGIRGIVEWLNNSPATAYMNYKIEIKFYLAFASPK